MLCTKYKTFYILTLATCAVDAQLTSNLVRGSGWTFPNCRIAKSTLYKSSLQKRKRKKNKIFTHITEINANIVLKNILPSSNPIH